MRRCRTFALTVAALLLLGAVPALAQSDDSGAGPPPETARAERAMAANARSQAQQWLEMAKKAHARATSATGTIKEIEEQSAANDETEAKRLNDEADAWEQKARQLEQTAQPSTVQPPEVSPSGGFRGPTNPPGGSEANGGAAPNSTPATTTSEQPQNGADELRTTSLNSRTEAGPPEPPSDTCGCPVIKPVATSEAPAPGKVEFEISEADIEDQFSNRELAYKDNWDKAFLALNAAIDPKGALHLARGPAPTVEDLDAAPLREGYLSRQLIEGPEAPIAPGARLSPAQAKARLESQRGSRMLTLMLVNTIARANKYGSTEMWLREDALRAERYMADDLARAFVDPSDSRSLYIANVRDEAFSTLMGLLGVATPRKQEERAKRPPPAPNPRKRDLLPLDDFDRANAALDVYLSRDVHGEHGIFTPPRVNEPNILVNTLVALAAARKEFGGNAVPGSPPDAVACKAFNTLVRIADARVAGTAKLRSELLELLLLTSSQYPNESAAGNLGHGAPERSMFAVTRSAFTVAGADEEEAKRAVDSIIEAMISGAPDNLERMVDVLKFYQAHVGGDAHPMARAEVAAEIQRQLEIMRKRRAVATEASRAELRALDSWDRLEVTAGDSEGPKPACGPPGQCCEKCEKEEPTVTKEDWDTTSTIVFFPPGPRAVDQTTDSLLANDGVSALLRVPTERASGNSADITLRNARTGKTQRLRLDHRYDQRNGIFTTYSNSEQAHLDLAVDNGDTIVAEFPGAQTAWFDVFTGEIQRTIARVQRSLTGLGLEFQAAAESGANAALLQKKQRMIQNARVFLAYRSRPDDRFFYTERSKAYIGVTYLSLLNQSSFDQTPGGCRGDAMPGADTQFPGVDYQFCEEHLDVQLDLQRAHEQAQALGLHNLAQGSIILYRGALTAQCFSAGLLCAENLWVLTTGTTVTGEKMSTEDLALFGINQVTPLIFSSALSKMVDLEYFSAAQYGPARAQADLEKDIALYKASAAAEEAESLRIIRRSDLIRLGGGSDTSGQVQIGSRRAAFYLPTQPLFPGGRIVIPKHLDPSSSTHYQAADDTCLLTAFEEARRNAGLTPRTWKESIDLAYERSVTVDAAGGIHVDMIYKPESAFFNGSKYKVISPYNGQAVEMSRSSGSYMHKFPRYMEMDGAEVLKVSPGHRFNVADLEYALSKQRQVIARVTFPGTDVGHAILIRSVDVAADGRKTVRFFNPAHGFDETAGMCAFTKQWDPYQLLIFRFKGK